MKSLRLRQSLRLRRVSSRGSPYSGFSLIEISVVLFILGVLISISTPPFLLWLSRSRVDEAKALLNSAISECLQEYRVNPEGWQTKKPDVLERQLPGNYQYSSGKDKCQEIAFEDKKDPKILPDLSFKINNEGKIFKTARIYDPAFESAAKSFGPTSLSPSAIAINACLEQKSICLQGLNTYIASGVDGLSPVKDWSGECRFPVDQNAGCNLPVWTFRKFKYLDLNSYNAAVDQALGEKCRQERQKLINSKHTGATPQDVVAIPCPRSWWFEGAEVGTETAYLEKKCKQDRENARVANYRGRYGPYSGPSECGKIVWMCNGTEVSSEEAYKTTSCGQTCRTENKEECYDTCIVEGRTGCALWGRTCTNKQVQICS